MEGVRRFPDLSYKFTGLASARPRADSGLGNWLSRLRRREKFAFRIELSTFGFQGGSRLCQARPLLLEPDALDGVGFVRGGGFWRDDGFEMPLAGLGFQALSLRPSALDAGEIFSREARFFSASRVLFLALAPKSERFGVAALTLQQGAFFLDALRLERAKLVGASSVFFEEPLALDALLLPSALLGLFPLAALALFFFPLRAGFPLAGGALLGFLSLLLFLTLAGGRVGERGKGAQRERGEGEKDRASVHGRLT